jgi:hypothetical protein
MLKMAFPQQVVGDFTRNGRSRTPTSWAALAFRSSVFAFSSSQLCGAFFRWKPHTPHLYPPRFRVPTSSTMGAAIASAA